MYIYISRTQTQTNVLHNQTRILTHKLTYIHTYRNNKGFTTKHTYLLLNIHTYIHTHTHTEEPRKANLRAYTHKRMYIHTYIHTCKENTDTHILSTSKHISLLINAYTYACTVAKTGTHPIDTT